MRVKVTVKSLRVGQVLYGIGNSPWRRGRHVVKASHIINECHPDIIPPGLPLSQARFFVSLLPSMYSYSRREMLRRTKALNDALDREFKEETRELEQRLVLNNPNLYGSGTFIWSRP